jgi:hypothetical protein
MILYPSKTIRASSSGGSGNSVASQQLARFAVRQLVDPHDLGGQVVVAAVAVGGLDDDAGGLVQVARVILIVWAMKRALARE